MQRDRRAARVGLTLAVAVALLAAAVLMVGEQNFLFTSTNDYFVEFRNVGGLAEYRRLAMRAWASLDQLIGSGTSGEATILNLDTDKASGVQWSGMVVGDRIWVQVSNLGPKDGVTIRLAA